MVVRFKFEDFIKEVYDVDLEVVDAQIDDYYHHEVELDGIRASEDECKQIGLYIDRYNEERSENIKFSDLQVVSDSVLKFSTLNRMSQNHYEMFINKYKDQVVSDFVKAEKYLYEISYLLLCGVYKESYGFDLDVEIDGPDIIIKGNLDSLDAMIMGCSGEYYEPCMEDYRVNFGDSYNQRFINGVSLLKNFVDEFNSPINIFKPRDLSCLYGVLYSENVKVEYDEFIDWLGSMGASEIVEF